MRDLSSGEKHGRSVRTRRGARTAPNASRGFHRQIGIVLRNRNRVCLWRGACALGNKSPSLYDAIQCAAIDYQIFHKRERSHAKRFDRDLRAVAKLSHVKFAHRARMIGSVWFAVDRERASAANTFAAIRIERDRFLSAFDQRLIENVEHFEKRGVRRDVANFVIDECATWFSTWLAQNSQAAGNP